MDQDDQTFLRDFFRAVADRPLEPDDDFYVPIYDEPSPEDPVRLLAHGIEYTPGQSVQLLSGFRGTGKSTELRRLRSRLQANGYVVALCDIEDYVNLSTPIDVSDFLMALAGAFSEAVSDPKILGQDPAIQSYWERLIAFLTRTDINFEELKLKPNVAGVAAEMKASLKSDPTFKQKLQTSMAGHLGTLVKDVWDYVQTVVRRIKKKHNDATEVVLLVDSLERLRGTSVNAEEVHRSVETLFAGHSDKLNLPNVHVVYTTPPFLKVRYPNIGALYIPGGLRMLPAIKLREDETGEANPAGWKALTNVIATRGDWQRLLGKRQLLDELIRHSGGHLRDLLRLLAEVIRRAEVLPVQEATVTAAINQVRREFLPIATEDAMWLQQVAESHEAQLQEIARLPDLARFLDTHMILCYHNGHEWYDVHPLIAETVKKQADDKARRDAISAADSGSEPDQPS